MRRNLASLLALLLIMGSILGYGFFYLSTISPGLQARTRLASEVVQSRKTLVSVRGVLAESPEQVQDLLENAQATWTADMDDFLTDSQVTQVINALYDYASASSVTITQLQTQDPFARSNQATSTPKAKPSPTRPATPKPTVTALSTLTQTVSAVTAPPTGTPTVATPTLPSLYHITELRLEAAGSSRQLIDFVSRIKETAAKSFVISSLTLSGDGEHATLTLHISLYSSSDASGRALMIGEAQAELTPTVVPTRVPTRGRKLTHYTVRWGDSLVSLARQFGTSVQAIMDANGLPDSRIYAGQDLLIPEEQAQEDSPQSKPYSEEPKQQSLSIATTGYTLNPGAPSGLPAQGVLTASFHDPRYAEWFPGRVHEGIDLAMPEKSPVVTTMAGRVAWAGDYGEWGNVVGVENGAWLIIMAHLSEIDVQPGQVVEQGQQVGLSGNTGRSSGPHVHYEVHYNGVATNPLPLTAAGNQPDKLAANH